MQSRLAELYHLVSDSDCDKDNDTNQGNKTASAIEELLVYSKEVSNRILFSSESSSGGGLRSSLLMACVKFMHINYSSSDETVVVKCIQILETLSNVANNPTNRKVLVSEDAIEKNFDLLPLLVKILNENVNENKHDVSIAIAERFCSPLMELLMTLAGDDDNKAAMVHTEWLLVALVNIFKKSSKCTRIFKNMSVSLLGILCLNIDNRIMMMKLPLSIPDALFSMIQDCNDETSITTDTKEGSASVLDAAKAVNAAKDGAAKAVWALRSFSLSRDICIHYSHQQANLRLLVSTVHSSLRSAKFEEHFLQICIHLSLCGVVAVNALFEADAHLFIHSLLDVGPEIKKWKFNSKKALSVALICASYAQGKHAMRDLFGPLITLVLNEDANKSIGEVKQCIILYVLLYGKEWGVVDEYIHHNNDDDNHSQKSLFDTHPLILETISTLMSNAVTLVISSEAPTVRRKDYVPIQVLLVAVSDLLQNESTRATIMKIDTLPVHFSKLIELYIRNSGGSVVDLLNSDADDLRCSADMLKNILTCLVMISFDIRKDDTNTILHDYFMSNDLTTNLELLDTQLDADDNSDQENKNLNRILIQRCSSSVETGDIMSSAVIQASSKSGIFLSSICNSCSSPSSKRAALGALLIDLALKTSKSICCDSSFRGSSEERMKSLTALVSDMFSSEYLVMIVNNDSRYDVFGRCLANFYLSGDIEVSQRPKLVILLEEGTSCHTSGWIADLLECGSVLSCKNNEMYSYLKGGYEDWNAVECILDVIATTEVEAEAESSASRTEIEQLSLQSIAGNVIATNKAIANDIKIQQIKDDLRAESQAEMILQMQSSFIESFVNTLIESSCVFVSKDVIERNIDNIDKLEKEKTFNACIAEEKKRSEELRFQLSNVQKEVGILQQQQLQRQEQQRQQQQPEQTEDIRQVEFVSDSPHKAGLHHQYIATPPPSARPLFTSPRSVSISQNDTPATSSYELTPPLREISKSVMINPLEYIRHPKKVTNLLAMEALLEDYGISEVAEIALCDKDDVGAIAALLKPIPRKAFLKEIDFLTSSLI